MPWSPDEDPATRDEDRRPRTGRGNRRRRALTGALIGAVLLGGAGAVYAADRTDPVAASALVLSNPDPAAVENPATGEVGGDPAARNATFLETELVYLNGTDLADQVQAAVGAGEPDIEAARVGDSNVIEITATADDATTATATAQQTADIYVAARQQRLTDRIQALLTATTAQIDSTNASITALGAPPTNAAAFDPDGQQRVSLAQQVSDLLSIRDTLTRAVADVPQSASLVQSAAVLPGGVVSSFLLTVLGGVLLGALLGALVPVLVGVLRGRVRDESDVADLGAPLLSPPLPRATGSRRQAALARAVQLQALQLPDGPTTGGSVAVVAATAGVGTSFVALQHARHAARRGRTLLVLATDDAATAAGLLGAGAPGRHAEDAQPVSAPEAALMAAQPTSVPNLWVLVVPRDEDEGGPWLVPGLVPTATGAGWSVVVDTAPLDRSDRGVQAARQCREVVLVAGVGRTRTSDLDRALTILRAADLPLSGVVVNHPPARTGAGLPGRAEPAPTSGSRGRRRAPRAAGERSVQDMRAAALAAATADTASTGPIAMDPSALEPSAADPAATTTAATAADATSAARPGSDTPRQSDDAPGDAPTGAVQHA